MNPIACTADADIYCLEHCPYPDACVYDHGAIFADSESDTPENCAICLAPINSSLTGDGVAYVLDTARDMLRTPRDERNTVSHEYDGTYWEGSRRVEIVRAWIERLYWYALTPRESRFMDLFMSRTRA